MTGRGHTRRDLLRAAGGTASAAVVGTAATGTAAAQTDYDGWFTGDAKGGATDNYDGTTADRTGEDQVTIQVGTEGNGGPYAFDPPAVRVSPGTEVTFEWVSNTHTVTVESQPDGADWQGHAPIENEGFSFSHTFETQGVYTYYCEPHLSLGMKGAVVVGPAPGGGGGGPAPSGPQTVSRAWEAFFVGTVLVGMLVPILLSYYRGGAAPADVTTVEEAPVEEPKTEIPHDGYDPVGTATLVVLYFLILVGMWVFMYFVEFLGNGPTVIG